MLRQIQGREVQTPVPRLRDEHLPAVQLPGLVARDAQEPVDGVVRVVAVEVGPEDGVAAGGVPEEARLEEAGRVGQGEVVRVEVEHLVEGAAEDGLGFQLEVLPPVGGFLRGDLPFILSVSMSELSRCRGGRDAALPVGMHGQDSDAPAGLMIHVPYG